MADSEKLRKKHGVAEVVYLIVEDKGLKTEQTLTEQLKTIPEVKTVNSLVEYTGAQIPESFIPEDVSQGFRAGNYALCTIELGIGQGDSRISKTLKEIKDTADSLYDEVYTRWASRRTQGTHHKDLSGKYTLSTVAIL